MTKLKSTKMLNAVMFVVAGAILLSTTACSTVPSTVKEDVTLERQVEVRIPEAVFDTNFSRDQYTIIGMVSGEGTVTRRLVEEGIKPTEKAEKSLNNNPGYYSYYVLDYDKKYGSWSDEGTVNIDNIGDNKMSGYQQILVKKNGKDCRENSLV